MEWSAVKPWEWCSYHYAPPLWNTEPIGILDEDSNKVTPAFLEQMLFRQDWYEIGLSWKEDHPKIPDHYTVSLNYRRFLQRMLLKSPELLHEYNSIIRDQIEKGIVEPVNEVTENTPELCKIAHSSQPVHYLPHHCIIQWDEQTTKLRIVYNGPAKAKSERVSLNDFLKTEPNLLLNLYDILIRFQWHVVAVTAGIEKAFLMVEIKPSDRDMLCIV